MNLTRKKILVTGARGFLGICVVKKLVEIGAPSKNIRTYSSRELDLRVKENCEKAVLGVDVVIHLAAKVGGIGFNRARPGELYYDNAIMGIQLMEAARLAGVEKFVAVGTICAYPKFTPVPFREIDLWNGYPEETNAPYGLAKKMMLVQAQAYRQQYGFNAIYLLPVNLYGPGENINPESAHVLPDLIRKMRNAKKKNKSEVVLWGTGRATREFLYVDDAAEAIVKAVQKYDKGEPVNIGTGFEISIRDLAGEIKRLIGYQGTIVWDKTKPDGQPRRMLDTSKAEAEFDFKAMTSFKEGLRRTIEWHLEEVADYDR
ncbi:GDP-fucose synthetase [Candidatus Woesebacteria bacterium RIFCSPHIGHO2_01_FULL_44_21]|uniref:GDP-L-fucose synthase n=1 Tax=Candidatus Woesebacteria bacterium RIFCSPHIGHO2_01_FULL_44_21 TaxID=1802503 RepID=A0A1F7YVN3_9BACT|nr:MAG: GDP-fucose synthetase [Candidatus Woesebacteria bacterium RIFCSPHIGHO2_01_FULL_44_21]